MRRPWNKLDDAEYNARWIERVKGHCTVSDKGCWLWQHLRTYNGYAQYGYRGKSKTVHRVMYQIVNNVKLPSTLDVCHSCDFRACVNPDHLWVGTRKQNMQDCSAKGRADGQWKTHCKRGHPLSGDNLYINATSQLRSCKTCARRRGRIRNGWPVELADAMGPVPHGYRPVNAKHSRTAA